MIPKILHVTWPDVEILDDPSPLIQQGLAAFRQLNPTWDIKISTDHDVDRDLRRYLPVRDYDLIAGSKQFVEKCDLWRLIKVYQEGGMYMDIDRLCDTAMHKWLPDHCRFVLLINQTWDFSQDLIISQAGNPLLASVIELNLSRRRQSHRDIYWLGPQTYLHGISQSLGQEIDTNPGTEAMQELERLAGNIPWITVYRESPPLHTVLYRRGVWEFDYQQEKQKFYQKHLVKHWLDQ